MPVAYPFSQICLGFNGLASGENQLNPKLILDALIRLISLIRGFILLQILQLMTNSCNSCNSWLKAVPCIMTHLLGCVQNGPQPMHEVVVNAVRKAVSAATNIFATSSTILFLFIVICFLSHNSLFNSFLFQGFSQTTDFNGTQRHKDTKIE